MEMKCLSYFFVAIVFLLTFSQAESRLKCKANNVINLNLTLILLKIKVEINVISLKSTSIAVQTVILFVQHSANHAQSFTKNALLDVIALKVMQETQKENVF